MTCRNRGGAQKPRQSVAVFEDDRYIYGCPQRIGVVVQDHDDGAVLGGGELFGQPVELFGFQPAIVASVVIALSRRMMR